MYGILVTIFVLIAILQTLVILLQSSKGGGLAGAFGGGGMGAVFGGRGAATFLSKLTAGLAVFFMLIALILSLLNPASSTQRSLVEQERQTRASSPADVGVPRAPEQLLPTPPPEQPQQQNQGDQENKQ